MARLEYRMCNENNDYSLIYYYDNINLEEIATRFACDFFVKNDVVYEKTSCAVNVMAYVIYVQKIEATEVLNLDESTNPNSKFIRLEIRQYADDSLHYPLLTTLEFKDSRDILLYLQSDFIFIYGKEWEKTSSEIDEDRNVYVCYVNPIV